jgi:hypothetical protein
MTNLSLIKGIFKKIILYHSLLSFRSVLILKKEKIVFIDIDNTIADTESFLKSNGDIKDLNDFLRIRRLDGTFDFINANFFNSHKYIFLSHRPFSSKSVTYSWLKINSFWNKGAKLYLVGDPSYKIYFFSESLRRSRETIIIDDLSFNQEKGKTLFYDKVIKYIKDNHIKYYDLAFIKKIN